MERVQANATPETKKVRAVPDLGISVVRGAIGLRLVTRNITYSAPDGSALAVPDMATPRWVARGKEKVSSAAQIPPPTPLLPQVDELIGRQVPLPRLLQSAHELRRDARSINANDLIRGDSSVTDGRHVTSE